MPYEKISYNHFDVMADLEYEKEMAKAIHGKYNNASIINTKIKEIKAANDIIDKAIKDGNISKTEAPIRRIFGAFILGFTKPFTPLDELVSYEDTKDLTKQQLLNIKKENNKLISVLKKQKSKQESTEFNDFTPITESSKSADVNTELQKCFDAIEAQDLSVKDIDKKIKEVKKANDKINRMLSEDDIPGDPKNIIVVPVKVLAAGAIASTVTALVGIGLLGISALIAIGTIPMAFIKAICAAFAPGKERLEGIRDINTETIKFLEKLKARKSKSESVEFNDFTPVNELNAEDRIENAPSINFDKFIKALGAKGMTKKQADECIKDIQEANRKIDKALKTGDFPSGGFNKDICSLFLVGAALGVAGLALGVPSNYMNIVAGVTGASIAMTDYTEADLKRIKGDNTRALEALRNYRKTLKESYEERSVDMNSVISEYDYTHEAVWNGFLMNRISEQIEMNRYISECCAICEGVDVFDKLVAVNEGVTDKIKSAWEKAKAFFKRIWAKFIERLTSFFTSNQTYLDKYKEIILKKPLKAIDDVTMPNHSIGVQRLVGTTAPIMTDQMLDSVISILNKNGNDVDKSKVEFIDTYLMHSGKKFASENTENVEYGEFAVKYFKGGEDVTINAGSLNLADMYEFCRDFKKIKAALEKDRAAIDKSYDNMQKSLMNIDKELQSGKYGQQQQNNNQQNQQTNNQATNANAVSKFNQTKTKTPDNGQPGVQHNSVVYSAVYDTYIHELEYTPASDDKGTAGGKVSGSGVVNTTNSTSTVAANVKGNTYNAHGDNSGATDQSKQNLQKAYDTKDKDKVSNITKAMNIYQATAGTMFSSKLTAIESIRKDYMKILELHVKYYVGNEGAAPSQAQAQATNQSNVEKTNMPKEKQAKGQPATPPEGEQPKQ